MFPPGLFHHWWRHLPGLLDLLLHGPTPEPEDGTGPQPLVTHIHQWGTCKWNGQYWYARCMWSESCTARIAC